MNVDVDVLRQIVDDVNLALAQRLETDLPEVNSRWAYVYMYNTHKFVNNAVSMI